MSAAPCRRIGSLGTLTALVATAVPAVLLVSMSSAYADRTITTPGPLSSITTSTSLNCSVNEVGDSSGEWFGDIACGTFLALGTKAYGPSSVPAGNVYAAWKRVSQSAVTGSGTAGDPYTVTTNVAAATTGVTLSQVDTYVTGQQQYRTDVTITNGSAAAQAMTLFRAGDCYFSDSDTGFGRIDGGTAPACVAPSYDDPSQPGTRIESMVPITAGSAYMEGHYHDIWDRISARHAFANVCRCDASEGAYDNGLGLSWPVTLAAGAATTISQSTYFSPPPLRVQVQADDAAVVPGASDGFTVTLSNPTATSVTADAITDTLPAGFTYTAGSTTGDITADPAVTGSVLTWSGPFALAPQTQVSFHFGVTAGSDESDADDTASATVSSPADQTVAPGTATVHVHPVTVTSVYPQAAATGTTGSLQLSGTTFHDGGTISVSGSGVTLTDVAVSDSTSASATYTVSPTATPGKRDVTFTDASGHSGTCVKCFTVDQRPVITAVTPSVLGQGAVDRPVVLTGLRFRPDAQVYFANSSVTSVTVVNSKEIDLLVSVPATSPLRDVLTLDNGDGAVVTRNITITAKPRATAASPAAPHGATTTVTVTGVNFQPGIVVSSAVSGLTFGTPTNVTSTSLDVAVTVAATKAPGTYNLTLTNPDGGRYVSKVLQVS